MGNIKDATDNILRRDDSLWAKRQLPEWDDIKIEAMKEELTKLQAKSSALQVEISKLTDEYTACLLWDILQITTPDGGNS